MSEYLIKRVKEKEVVKRATSIPGTAQQKRQEGKVIAVEHGKKTEGGKVEAIYWSEWDQPNYLRSDGEARVQMGGSYVRKTW